MGKQIDDSMADILSELQNAKTIESIYAPLHKMNLVPGWVDQEQPVLTPAPRGKFLPALWTYSECKQALDAAGRLIGTDLAERRNLILRNDIQGNGFATTRTMVNAYQMILPGERARSHRHTPHALRVIIDARKAYSIVDGEKTLMESGDIVLTPGWCWHGHGHDGDEPAYWLDGLDVPLTLMLEPMFFEVHADGYEGVERLAAESPMRFTWSSIQLRTEKASQDPDGYFGRRVKLDTPTMPTITIYVDRLVAGQKTRKYRATANTVFSPMLGSGRSIIGGQVFNWQKGDTISAPLWNWIEHEVETDTIMFSMSDEQLMRFSNYYRFEGS